MCIRFLLEVDFKGTQSLYIISCDISDSVALQEIWDLDEHIMTP